jgi:acyl dehydratase
MEGRFSAPVLPGEKLAVQIWVTGDGEALFRTRAEDGRTVLDARRCTDVA